MFKIPSENKNSVRRNLRVGLVIPFLFTALVCFLFAWQVNRLLSLSNWIAHTDRVIGEIRLTEKLFLDMETGVRGYYLTQKLSFLEPFLNAKEQVDTQIEKLKALMNRSSSEVKLLNELEKLTENWADSRQGAVPDRAKRSLEFFLSGKLVMDRIRDLCNQMIVAQEEEKSKKRLEITRATQTSYIATISLAIVVGILFSFTLYRLIQSTSSIYESLLAKQQADAAKLEEAKNELEAKVAERTLSLMTANEELEAFCYSVSHDLRAPLRGVDGFSKALLEDYESTLDERAKQYIGYVRQGIQKMGQLIDDLLNLSRLTRAEMVAKKVNLSKEATEIAEKLNHGLSEEKKVAFSIQDGLTATGDPTLLSAVLENLLSNAWKFSGKTSERKVEFGTLESNKKPTFFIKDNGAGFDMAYYSKLFGAFQRLHSVKEFEGTGVGLATVRRIINRHGGSIWAESKPGEGATFYFTLEPEINT